MKKIKILVSLIAILSISIYSCSDNNSVDKQGVAKKSISLRTTLNQIKKNNNINGRTVVNDSLCFDFVYPINLSYNNGTNVEVTSFDGMITLLQSENNSLYIEGIVFPFQVTQNSIIQTINNELEFNNLINNCDYESVEDDLYDNDCFEMVYPFSIINQNNQTILISSEVSLNNFFGMSSVQNFIIDFVFPFTVIQNNQIVSVNSIYDFFNILNSCDTYTTDCICTTEANPVCVNDSIGNTITFGNPCLAACEGYTAADFVNCQPVNTANFGTQLGTCFNVNYPVQIQYQGALVTATNNGELLQYWFSAQSSIPAFSYPISVTFISTNTTITVNSQTQFTQLISQNCN